jgi:segregation and condensation protein B
MKSAFESMMFVWGDPLDAKIAANAMNIERAEALECFRELAQEYDAQERGIRIREADGKFQFVTYEENYDYIRSIVTPAKERRLTQAALETLAIIAYKQPVTKGEIDSIRGIKSERVIEGLMKKGLVEERGRSNAVGRPILYGTTDLFLTNFDLTTIKELPQIEDIEEAIQYVEPMTVIDSRQTSIDFEQLVQEEGTPDGFGAPAQGESQAPTQDESGTSTQRESQEFASESAQGFAQEEPQAPVQDESGTSTQEESQASASESESEFAQEEPQAPTPDETEGAVSL